MKKTLVIGASGKIGQILLSKYVESIDRPVALVRNQNKCSFHETVEVVEADLEGDFDFALKDCDTVIFSAGSGANTGLDKTLLIDLWAACKVIDAAKKYGARHFIMVSSRGADNPDNGPLAIKPYLIAKHFADSYLIQSGLDYTVLQPGRLTDEDSTGLIKISRPNDPNMQFISREDTAEAIHHCIGNNNVINKTYELYSGQNPINIELD